MKRSTYFISARSPSADVLGSELILALREQFPKVEGFGVVGRAMARTRAASIATLEQCMTAGLHDSLPHDLKQLPQASAEVLAAIRGELDKSAPQVAILVGYSGFHDYLADYFKSRQIPVILYGMTPIDGWLQVSPNQLDQKIDLALGVFPRPDPFLKKSCVPYQYVGSPFRDRTDRVHITRQALGLRADGAIISFYPGTRLATFKKLFPLMEQAASRLRMQYQNLQLLLPLSSYVFEKAKSEIFQTLRIVKTPDPRRFFYDPFQVMHNMSLEVLSLSSIAVTGGGAATVECCLFDVPFVPVVPLCEDAVPSASGSCLVNQIWDRPIVQELSETASVDQLVQRIQTLIDDSESRAALLKDFAEVRSSLQGFAAENAAGIIGNDIAQWNIKKKTRDPRPA